MAILWRISCLLLAVFFSLAMVVQHNDPDWYVWIPIYALPCIISWIQVLKPDVIADSLFQVITKLSLLVYATLSIKLFAHFISFDGSTTSHESLFYPNGTNKTTSEELSILSSEEGRELLGSLIITLWLLLCCIHFVHYKDLTTGHKVFLAAFAVLPLILWLVHIAYDINLC